MAGFKPAARCGECGAESAPERGTAGPQVLHHGEGCSKPAPDVVRDAPLQPMPEPGMGHSRPKEPRMTKPKPTKVSTAARIATLGVLAGMRPRTPLPTLTGLVDGAAVLVEAGQPAIVVAAMFGGLRLDPDQLAAALDALVTTPAKLHVVPEAEAGAGAGTL